MLGEIVLLTGEVEAPFLTDILHQHAPALRVVHAEDRKALDKACEIPSELGPRRLIAFCTSVIVSASVLDALDGPAYNLHPGPPTYPGTHPASFAVYEGADRFGATLHEMAARVDSGTIVAVDWFDMPPDLRFSDLEIHAYRTAIALFTKMAKRLATDPAPLPASGDTWSGTVSTRKMFERMQQVTEDMSEEEIVRRFRAFG